MFGGGGKPSGLGAPPANSEASAILNAAKGAQGLTVACDGELKTVVAVAERFSVFQVDDSLSELQKCQRYIHSQLPLQRCAEYHLTMFFLTCARFACASLQTCVCEADIGVRQERGDHRGGAAAGQSDQAGERPRSRDSAVAGAGARPDGSLACPPDRGLFARALAILFLLALLLLESIFALLRVTHC